VTGIRETGRSFQLLGDHDRVRHELPKRGLRDPGLILPLRQFMQQAVSTPQHAGGPETPAGGQQGYCQPSPGQRTRTDPPIWTVAVSPEIPCRGFQIWQFCTD
jgi:hypothetical protein